MKSWGVGLALVLTTTIAGCKAGVTTDGATTPDPAYTDGTAGGGDGAATGGPGCARPDDHCLEPGELLVAEQPFESGYTTVRVGTAAGAPSSSGEASYTLADGETVTTRTAYKTHRATPDELVVGALVAAPDLVGDGNVYRAPNDRQEATGSWFVARIVSVDPVAQGHVLLSGGYAASVDALRRVEGDPSTTVATPGAEDAMFLKPEHWFVGDAEVPATGYLTVLPAIQLEAPSAKTNGEGRFLVTQTGQDRWARHAWKSRAATQADVKKGAVVIVADLIGDGNVYRAPTSRAEALQSGWFAGKITDTTELHKGVVTVAGDYRVQVDGLRVPVQ